MRHNPLTSFVRLCWARLANTATRKPNPRPRYASGQVAVYAAMLLTVMMGLAGAGVDYALIVIHTAKLQNAMDAAALAGARAQVTALSAATQDTAGQTAAAASLLANGYTNGQNGFTVTYTQFASDGTSTWHDGMTANGTVVLPTKFWKVIKINNTTLNRTATAVAGGGMVDVMLSLDLTGSMERSGTNDLGQLRDAVVDFIDQMQVDPANLRGTQVGIARFAGIKCRWWRGFSGGSSNQGADGDSYIDTDRGPHGSEYVTPCDDDKTVIQPLTMNRDTLVKVARNDGTATCPTVASGYGCPLVSAKYQRVPVTYGTPTVSGTPIAASGLQESGSTYPPDGTSGCNSGSEWCMATGTKISNGFSVTKEGGYCAWSTGNGGRNDPSTTGVARKVLVMMTDGKNESSQLGVPTNYTPSLTDWDQATRDAAASIKLGCDGVAGTVDDVEIYVVGFFCTPYSSSSSWCQSRIADTSTAHKCPGPTWPTSSPSPSSVDTLLRDLASNSPNTCDHYFPIKKTEDLPQLFRVMAGSIARGRLQ